VALDGDGRFAAAKWTSGQCVQVSDSEWLGGTFVLFTYTISHY